MKTTRDSEKSAVVFDVYRGTTHDGPGLRTTVFFKGCPLRCRWCQNPEGISPNPEVWWNSGTCIGCGTCVRSCPQKALSASGAVISVDRTLCRVCGTCAAACPSEAMAVTGTVRTMESLLEESCRDSDYYEIFGGGVTASGGEPLLQHEFLTEFFRRLKLKGINTALDTCGAVPWNNMESVLKFTDCVLYDIKLAAPEQHRKFTGMDNSLILDNLWRIVGIGKRLWIRTPLIPGVTAVPENISAIAGFIGKKLGGKIERWELCAFNAACAAKYAKLGRNWTFAGEPPMEQNLIDTLKTAAFAEGISPELLVVSGIIAAEKD